MDLLTNTGPLLLTLDDAAEVCELVVRHGCRGVGIFGSIARDGKGNDINLAILTETSVAETFLAKGLDLANDTKLERASMRRGLVAELIGLDFLTGIPSLDIDIDPFLFPSSIRRDVSRLARTVPGSDGLGFLTEVTRDLRLFDPTTHEFWPARA